MNDERKATRPMLKKISAKNVLSFGPDGMELELRPLNVLIGPNGSGKSNLFELLNFLRAAPTDLSAPVRTGGGVSEWIWRGNPDATAVVEAVVENPSGRQPLRHTIEFRESGRLFTLADERIENESPYLGYRKPHIYYSYGGGIPVLNVRDQDNGERHRELRREDIELDKSILSQRKDRDTYPELTYLSAFYSGVSTYGYWEFGRSAEVRRSQRNDALPSPLREDVSNLGMFLNHLELYPAARRKLAEHLSALYEEVSDYALHFDPSTVQIRFTEGDFSIPLSRLSDGSLRYLALLAILLDPEPPSLIAIEEPELGLHFDILPKMANLLVDASSRTQLIITTHSDVLVDLLSPYPESLIICQKRNGQSSMKRPDKDRLTRWLKRHTLGQLWSQGQLGGVRW